MGGGAQSSSASGFQGFWGASFRCGTTILGKNKKFAFTLAEVLITLGIIGVVAAMTMPTLIQKHQEKATVAKLKKVYSILSQAYMQAINEHGAIDNWGLVPMGEPAVNAAPKLKPYLKVIDDCGVNDCENYSIRGGHFYILNGRIYPSSKYNNDYKLKLADGTELSIRENSRTQISILVDLNGKQGPNTMGKDIFSFLLLNNNKVDAPGVGIDPSDTSIEYFPCNLRQEGWYCTGWVIYNENMDYLRCADELSWNGKTKCK